MVLQVASRSQSLATLKPKVSNVPPSPRYTSTKFYVGTHRVNHYTKSTKKYYIKNMQYIYHNQGSTEGSFLPSAEAEAEGAKKLRPSAEDRS